MHVVLTPRRSATTDRRRRVWSIASNTATIVHGRRVRKVTQVTCAPLIGRCTWRVVREGSPPAVEHGGGGGGRRHPTGDGSGTPTAGGGRRQGGGADEQRSGRADTGPTPTHGGASTVRRAGPSGPPTGGRRRGGRRVVVDAGTRRHTGSRRRGAARPGRRGRRLYTGAAPTPGAPAAGAGPPPQAAAPTGGRPPADAARRRTRVSKGAARDAPRRRPADRLRAPSCTPCTSGLGGAGRPATPVLLHCHGHPHEEDGRASPTLGGACMNGRPGGGRLAAEEGRGPSRDRPSPPSATRRWRIWPA